jgi:glyoxylase I family protein
MIAGIHHVAISTPDADRLLAFYRDVLGFEEVMDFTWPPGTDAADRITALDGSSARQIMLRKGGSRLELFQFHAPEPSPGDPRRPVCDHGITHLCLAVTDIDAEYARLRDAGMEFHCEPQELAPGLHTTYGRDPDGNVVELHQFAAA